MFLQTMETTMNRFTLKMGFFAVAAMLIFALATSATAASFTHVGLADPANDEGWTPYILGGSSYAGTDEMAHWEIASAPPHAFKADGLTDPVAQSIIYSPNGWSLEATVKAVAPLAAINTITMRVVDNLGDCCAAGTVANVDRCLVARIDGPVVLAVVTAGPHSIGAGAEEPKTFARGIGLTDMLDGYSRCRRCQSKN